MGDYLRQAYEEVDNQREEPIIYLDGRLNGYENKDLEIAKLKFDIKSLCDIILKLEPRYEQWIEKNIGKEYLNNNG